MLSEEANNQRFMLMALQLIGECTADLARVAIQGVRSDNEINRGGIAAGLERAAAYVRLQPFKLKIDPKHIEHKEFAPEPGLNPPAQAPVDAGAPLAPMMDEPMTEAVPSPLLSSSDALAAALDAIKGDKS
jgi:hypothetical protein